MSQPRVEGVTARWPHHCEWCHLGHCAKSAGGHVTLVGRDALVYRLGEAADTPGVRAMLVGPRQEDGDEDFWQFRTALSALRDFDATGEER